MILAMHLYRLDLPDETSTQAFGAALAVCIRAGFVLYLQGDLGAGKTTFTRALLKKLGVTGTLRSPSYALLEPYDLSQLCGATLHHFDFYRLQGTPLAWKDAGFEVAFEAPHAAIVEWPEYAQDLPLPNMSIRIIHVDNSRRAELTVYQSSTALDAVLKTLDAKQIA